MNDINYSEEPNDLSDIFLTDRQLELTKKINAAIAAGSNYDDDDGIDNENMDMVDCKYYTIDLLNDQKLNTNKNLSILHLNIHSVEFHIDELRITLQLLDTSSDFICQSESKIRVDQLVKVDINIDGYQQPIGMPTESSKRGFLMYIKKGINFYQRNDLDVHKSKKMEPIFVEVLNPKGNNTIIGTMYRHILRRLYEAPMRQTYRRK